MNYNPERQMKLNQEIVFSGNVSIKNRRSGLTMYAIRWIRSSSEWFEPVPHG